MRSAIAVIEETLSRLNPQLSGVPTLAVRLADALEDAGLLWCEDELDFGRPTITVDVTAGCL